MVRDERGRRGVERANGDAGGVVQRGWEGSDVSAELLEDKGTGVRDGCVGSGRIDNQFNQSKNGRPSLDVLPKGRRKPVKWTSSQEHTSMPFNA